MLEMEVVTMKTITLKDLEKIKTAVTRKSDTIPNGHGR